MKKNKKQSLKGNLEKERVVKLVVKFIRKLEEQGVKAQVQFKVDGSAYHIPSKMPVHEVLGMLNLARLVTENGLKANHTFDAFVQGIESRPDLVTRLQKALLSERACSAQTE